MRENQRRGLVALAAAVLAAPASAQLFVAGDPILAVDSDTIIHSNYPDGEAPFQCFDQFPETKYLNFGEGGTGVIVTPEYGASVVVSMQFYTANDAVARDPASYELYGTNDAIVSEDNSTGTAEDWTLITSGAANLPDDRLVPGPVYDFANGSSYTSYKIIFPTIKDTGAANSMQIAEIQLYTGAGAGGDPVCTLLDFAIAIGWEGSASDYPGAEGPANALDGDSGTKYLNFGKENSGFIVSRADGESVVVEQFTITTANDFPERDPTSWELYGTNDPVTSEDNSTGLEEDWTFVDSGVVDLPLDRFTAGPTVSVDNDTAYSAYKMLFPSIRDTAAPGADSVQYADVLIEGEGGEGCPADTNNDDMLDFFDVQLFLNWYASDDLRADFADDDVLDFFDVQAYLNLYSAGCP